MKIALTADSHLTSLKAYPERYHAFEYILGDAAEKNVHNLIVAGDLFHESNRNYADFENLCSKSPFRNIQIWILPGNHDSEISDSMFSLESIHVVSEPQVHRFDSADFPFFFLPYQRNTTMGSCIAPFAGELQQGSWILIGHGDWVGGIRQPNPLEPGIYMPLNKADIGIFQPARVVLGHIHKPADGAVYYAGSPCPLDIHETGKRRYLIVDGRTGRIESRKVDSEIIYFDETFIVLPVPDEGEYLSEQARRRIEKWQISPEEKARVRIRIKIAGYSADKRKIKPVLEAAFSGWSFFDDPDLSLVHHAEDRDKAEIAGRVARKIAELEWPQTDDEPQTSEILLEALHAIYGE